MNLVAKGLIFIGLACVVVGLILLIAGRYLPLGRLPGDIVVEKNGFRIYFPIVTCIVLSVAASFVMYLVRLFHK